MQAMTTRGVDEEDTKFIAKLIHKTIQNMDAGDKLDVIRSQVEDLCSHFPIPSIK